MIQTYKQELRSRARKNFIFWVVVFLFASFLYFFFQGYYPNYRELIHPTDESKQSFLKPFGIIDIHVFPSPDSILVNDDTYSNSSRTIFDLGTYDVKIHKDGYIPVTFPIEITRMNPFYSNTLNLLRLPKYTSLGFDFNNIEKVSSVYFVWSGSKASFVMDKDLLILRLINTPYEYLGAGYFRANDTSLFRYEYTTDKYTQVLTKETGKAVLCPDWKIYGSTPFCPDSMKFIDAHGIDAGEKILAANEGIVTTDRYIYNQDDKNKDWKYYEYKNTDIHRPSSLFHIHDVPFVLENGSILPIDTTAFASGSLPKIHLDQITSTKEFGTETIFIGLKNTKGGFELLENNKRWSGTFDTSDIIDMQVEKVGGIYVFFSKKGAYVYYKGAREIFKIVNDPVITLIDSTLYFTKDDGVHSMDLLRK